MKKHMKFMDRRIGIPLSFLLVVAVVLLSTMNIEAKEGTVNNNSQSPTVYIASDSTAQTYDSYWKPQAGWGQMLNRFFSSDVTIDNHAIGGRSSKTFLTEGRLDNILEDIQPGDYLLIQFGHNDATISRPDRYVTVDQYKEYLEVYVESARDQGAIPVLVTPVGRRDFNAETKKFNVSFPEYVEGMEQVADEMDVLLVDLSTISREYYNEIGPEGSRTIFLHADSGIYEAHPNGVKDDTHFQEYGAIQIARLLSEAIGTLDTKLSDYVIDIEMPENVPTTPNDLKASNISNAGAFISWNEVEGADIYRIYLKHDSDGKYKLVNTSTVPQVNLSGMEDDNLYQVVVTAVNGKGESRQSDPVEILTKKATLKFDFGIEGSPVGDGYTEVNLSTLYTKEKGYGIVDNDGMIGRDRSNDDPVLRDWLGYFNTGWDFNVDVSNGLYAAKVYVADFLGSARTNLTIEGDDYGTISAPKEGWTEKVIPEIEITDGQMNFHFGGATGIANGLELTPILIAPNDLILIDQSFAQNNLSASISWEEAEGATSYNVYRKIVGSNKSELVYSTSETTYNDKTVMLGTEYEYTVTTVDNIGVETVPSLPLTVLMIDDNQQVPLVPTNLQLVESNKDSIIISWDEVNDATHYNIYRSEIENGMYELVGHTENTVFTDSFIPEKDQYFYKIAAVNSGGFSDKSSMLQVYIVGTTPTTSYEINTDPVNGWHNSVVNIKFSVDGDESGEYQIYYVVNDGEQIADDKLVLKDDGKYMIRYWNEDESGKVGEEGDFEISIDTTAPTIEFSIKNGATFSVNEEISLSCTFNEDLSGLESSDCDEETIRAYELGIGSHLFSAMATDMAGNQANKSIEITVTVDFSSLAELTELFVNENDRDEKYIEELISILKAAQKSSEAKDFTELNIQLAKYIERVEDTVGKSLTTEQSETLVSLANTLTSKKGEKEEKEERDEKNDPLSEKHSNDPSNDKNVGANNVLPQTATTIYNFLLLGLILIIVGGIIIYSHKKKINQKEN